MDVIFLVLAVLFFIFLARFEKVFLAGMKGFSIPTSLKTIEELRRWYLSNCSKNVRVARLLKLTLGLLFGYFIVVKSVFAFYLFKCLFIPDDEVYMEGKILRALPPVSVIIPLFFSVSAALFLFFKVKEKRAQFEYNVKKKAFSPLKDSEQETRSFIFNLAGSMGIQKERICIWKSMSPTYLPSIEESMGKINLVLPLNFFKLIKENPEYSKALVAHEFGHVLQKDTNSWLSSDTITKSINRILVPFIWFSFLLKLAAITIIFFEGILFDTADFGGYNLPIYLISMLDLPAYLTLIFLFPIVRKSRRFSEELADTAAIIYSDGRSLALALNRFCIPKDATKSRHRVHPELELRLQLIESKTQNYGIAIF